MNNYRQVLLIILLAGHQLQSNPQPDYKFTRFDAKPANGYNYPFYLVSPRDTTALFTKEFHLLVIPNNTGKGDNDLNVHEQDVIDKTKFFPKIFDSLNTFILIPVFPRPLTDYKLNTHTLDRYTMLTTYDPLKRIDLQLIAMIKYTRAYLKRSNYKVDKKIFLFGFSAPGMFVNRFVFLHPKIVKAAVVGSPGGWPIVPLTKWKNNSLRYPIGIDDFRLIAQTPINSKSLQKLPLLFMIGDKDDNDSVNSEDSYDLPDRKLIDTLFGTTPIMRWPVAEKIYRSQKMNAEFKTYRDTGHTISSAMKKDILIFFRLNN